MKRITKEEIMDNKEFYKREIWDGKIFVYPTDTIYGIGCNALLSTPVRRIREIKKRDEKPFSVIAPSKKWIYDSFWVLKKFKKYIDKLPGRYTLIFVGKSTGVICEEITCGVENVGIRIPDHWFADIITEAGVPFVTTSVNVTGQPPIKKPSELGKETKDKIDYVIDEGALENPPSTVIDLTGKKEKTLR